MHLPGRSIQGDPPGGRVGGGPQSGGGELWLWGWKQEEGLTCPTLCQRRKFKAKGFLSHPVVNQEEGRMVGSLWSLSDKGFLAAA